MASTLPLTEVEIEDFWKATHHTCGVLIGSGHEAEPATGCTCDKWGHPCPVCATLAIAHKEHGRLLNKSAKGAGRSRE